MCVSDAHGTANGKGALLPACKSCCFLGCTGEGTRKGRSCCYSHCWCCCRACCHSPASQCFHEGSQAPSQIGCYAVASSSPSSSCCC